MLRPADEVERWQATQRLQLLVDRVLTIDGVQAGLSLEGQGGAEVAALIAAHPEAAAALVIDDVTRRITGGD